MLIARPIIFIAMKSKIIVLIFSACISVLLMTSCGPDAGEGEKDNNTEQNLPEALQALNKAIEENPDNALLYNQRAIYYLEQKKPELALADVNKAIELDADNPVYYRSLSDIYFAMGKPDRCREALNKAIQVDDHDTTAYLKMAELEFYFKEYKKTFEYLNKALSLDERNAKAFFIRGIAYKELGDTAKAVKSLQMAVENDQEYYHAYMQLGLIHAAKHNPLAVDYYNNALNINPESIEAYYGLGMFYQEHEEYNRAIEAYTTILKIDPAYKAAHFNLGYIHLVYLRVFDVAAKHFSDAIKADPNYAEAYYNRGYCYELLGDVMNAKKDYQQATMVRPNYQKAIDGLNRIDAIINQ